MPARLLVVAEDRPVPDSPGAWRKGDIVTVQPEGWVWGNKETLPLFVRIDITTGDADLGWIQESTDGSGNLLNRRSVRVTAAEVDSIKAEWEGLPGPAPTQAHRGYSRGQFNSRVVTRQ